MQSSRSPLSASADAATGAGAPRMRPESTAAARAEGANTWVRPGRVAQVCGTGGWRVGAAVSSGGALPSLGRHQQAFPNTNTHRGRPKREQLEAEDSSRPQVVPLEGRDACAGAPRRPAESGLRGRVRRGLLRLGGALGTVEALERGGVDGAAEVAEADAQPPGRAAGAGFRDLSNENILRLRKQPDKEGSRKESFSRSHSS